MPRSVKTCLITTIPSAMSAMMKQTREQEFITPSFSPKSTCFTLYSADHHSAFCVLRSAFCVLQNTPAGIDLFKAVRQLTHWLRIPPKKELLMSTPHKDLMFQIHFQTSLKECGFA